MAAVGKEAGITPVAQVGTRAGTCPIYVGWGYLPRLGELARQHGLKGRAILTTDLMVEPLYAPQARQSLEGNGFPVLSYAIPPGESAKTLSQASAIYDFLVKHRVERGDWVVALGGGVVGDLAGFVAATFLRGLPWVALPTTLLAMVDAAIGGKVAVNHREGKNLIGAFHQPRFVLADVSLLSTLPSRELASGWAEVIKHAFTLEPDLLSLLEGQAEALLRLEPEVAVRAIALSAQAKARVVSQDEREETGLRTVLNYGHTIGHALEAATNYARFYHGEAIAIGMMGAIRLSQRLGLIGASPVERQRRLLERFGLPTSGTGVSVEAVEQAMELDKKSQGQEVRWVLLSGIGQPVLSPVPREEVRAVLRELVRG